MGGLIVLVLDFWPFSLSKSELQNDRTHQLQSTTTAVEPVQTSSEQLASVEAVQDDSLETILGADLEWRNAQAGDLAQQRSEHFGVKLPEYDDSDLWLLSEILKLGVPSSLLEGFATNGIAGRVATQMAAIAEGRVVRKEKGIARLSAFLVRQNGDENWLDERGFERYDHYVDALVLIEPATLAQFVSFIQPLLETGLRRLGDHRAVSEILRRACAKVLSVPVIEGDIRLVRPNVYYHFHDAALQNMTDLEKQFLRMGPKHTQTLQSYTRAFASAYFTP